MTCGWPSGDSSSALALTHARRSPVSADFFHDCWPSPAAQGCSSFLFCRIKKSQSRPNVSIWLSWSGAKRTSVATTQVTSVVYSGFKIGWDLGRITCGFDTFRRKTSQSLGLLPSPPSVLSPPQGATEKLHHPLRKHLFGQDPAPRFQWIGCTNKQLLVLSATRQRLSGHVGR